MNKAKSLLVGGAAVLTALAAPLLCTAACPCASAQAQPSPLNACALPSVDRESREAQYRDFLRDRDASLAGLTLRVSLRGDTAALRRQVSAIAAAERECCSPLTIRFEPAAGGGVVVVSADGEAGAHTLLPMLDALRR